MNPAGNKRSKFITCLACGGRCLLNWGSRGKRGNATFQRRQYKCESCGQLFRTIQMVGSQRESAPEPWAPITQTQTKDGWPKVTRKWADCNLARDAFG